MRTPNLLPWRIPKSRPASRTSKARPMLTTLALTLLLQVPATQQPLAPGTRYDPEIPTVKQVTGHDVREAITPPADIVRYTEALAKAAPERTRLIRYATSWEGRPLVMLLVGSA